MNTLFLFHEKLFFVSDEFIGFSPQKSEPIELKIPYADRSGKGNSTQILPGHFKIGGSIFHTILVYFFSYGPVRGYQRIEVLRNGKSIINFESGSHGHSALYRKGQLYSTGSNEAFLLAPNEVGYDEGKYTPKDMLNGDYRLYYFENIVIPKKWESTTSNIRLSNQHDFYPQEIEMFRKDVWLGKILVDGKDIYFKKSIVPGFERTYNGKFKVNPEKSVLPQVEILESASGWNK